LKKQNIGSSLNGAPHPWGWTAECRARQAAAIQSWRPWVNATEPKTPAGKAIVSRNADRRDPLERQLAKIAADMKRVERLVKKAVAKRGRKSRY
jgi:hypothetical protein